MALARFSPRKSISALRLRWAGRVIGSSRCRAVAGQGPLRCQWRADRPGRCPHMVGFSAAFGWKLFIEAQAFTSVPSTEKCSSDEQRRHLAVGQDRRQELAGDTGGAAAGRGSWKTPSEPRPDSSMPQPHEPPKQQVVRRS